MPLTQHPGRVRSLGPGFDATPPNRLYYPLTPPTPTSVPVFNPRAATIPFTPDQPFNLNLALQKVGRLNNHRVLASLQSDTRRAYRPTVASTTAVPTPFVNYTGRSMGDPVGMFNRVPGFGRTFRG